MAEKKTVGSVTYTQTDKEYFAEARPAPICTRLVALGAGCRRGDLRPLLGLEFRSAVRLRRDADRAVRDRSDVLGPDLQHRRDVAGAAAHRRGVFLRAQRARALGRDGHRSRREHRVHPDAGRHRVLHRLVHDGDLRDAGGSAALVVGRCVRGLPVPEPAWRGAVVQGLRARDPGRPRSARALLGERASAFRPRPLGAQHRRRAGWQGVELPGRQRPMAAVRHRRRTRRAAVRRVALPRDRAAAARGGGVL